MQTHIVKFDRRDYVGVDSVVLVAALSSSDSTVSAIADLYNHTDGTVVARSEAQTRSTTVAWAESGNLFADLPDKEVTIGLRIRPSVAGAIASVHAATLILYRR